MEAPYVSRWRIRPHLPLLSSTTVASLVLGCLACSARVAPYTSGAPILISRPVGSLETFVSPTPCSCLILLQVLFAVFGQHIISCANVLPSPAVPPVKHPQVFLVGLHACPSDVDAGEAASSTGGALFIGGVGSEDVFQCSAESPVAVQNLSVSLLGCFFRANVAAGTW